MSTPRVLSPEVWLVVFRHMSCAPLAHPKTNEKVPPNFQPTLAACSRLFHDLSASHLYVCPVVDSLSLFIAGIDNPPVAGLKSKAELLARTRHLFLEDTSEPDDKYSVSEEEVAAYATEVEEEVKDPEQLRREVQRKMELEDMLRTWRTILDQPHTPSSVFPRMTTVSVGAIHRSLGDWPPAYRSQQWAKSYQDLQDTLFEFLCEATGVRQYCQVAPHIFALEDTLFIAPLDRSLSISTHSDIYDPVPQPTSLGFQTRWIVHTDGHIREACDPNQATQGATIIINGLLQRRRELAADEAEINDISEWSIKGGLYVDIADAQDEIDKEKEKDEVRRWTESEEKKMAEILSAGKWGLPEAVKVSDSFEIKPLFDAACEACGWSGENAARPQGCHEWMDEHDKQTVRQPKKHRPL